MLKTTLLNVSIPGLVHALVAVVELSTAIGVFGEVAAKCACTQTTDVQWTTKVQHEASARSGPDKTLLSKRGCEAATAGTGNKIITYQGKTHVAWLDSNEEGYFAVIRTLDRKTGTWSCTHTIGKSNDNHGRPAMTIDSTGCLHVVYGLHHNAIPYRRSVRPNDASEWTEPVVFGGSLSYPTMMCGPDDSLYLTGRYGWGGVRLYVKPPGKIWEDRGLIMRSEKRCPGYAAFHSGLAWGPKQRVLHFACRTFQSTKRQPSEMWGDVQSVNYMRSTDFGHTWERANGAAIELPATMKTADVLMTGEGFDPKPGIRNDGTIVVDSKGNPYVLYYRNTPDKPGQSFLAMHDGDRWRQLPLQTAMDKHYPGCAIVDSRAGLSITADDVLCMTLIIAPIDHPEAAWDGKPLAKYFHEPAYWTNYIPTSKRIVWLESHDGGKTFTARPIVKLDAKRGEILPSLERPTGFNHIPAGSYPGLVYVSTTTFTKWNENKLVDNDVVWLQAKSR